MPSRDKKPPRTANAATRAENKPSFSIIGAGRLGTSLGIALRQAGYHVNLVIAKRLRSAKKAARLIDPRTVGLSAYHLERLTTQQATPLLASSVIIVATPDDVIGDVAKTLASVFRSCENTGSTAGKRPQIAFHTSGALSSGVLRPVKDLGLSIGSFHPLISISDPQAGAEALRGAWFSLEGQARAVRAGRKIVSSIGGNSFTISSDAKPLYHAAAMMASPNLTALVDIALEMLTFCGLKESRAREILVPLIRSTVENLAQQPPRKALTGTFKRGDTATVRKHIAAMKSHDLREALGAYVLLGKRSLSLANQRHNAEIEKLLGQASQDSTKRH